MLVGSGYAEGIGAFFAFINILRVFYGEKPRGIGCGGYGSYRAAQPENKIGCGKRLFIAPYGVFAQLKGVFKPVFFKAFRRAANNGAA